MTRTAPQTGWRCGAGVVVATLIAGCSLAPDYHRPAAPVSPTYPTGDAYGPGTAAPAGALPATAVGWRNFLTDPRLQRLVAIALANNRDLRVAVLNIAQARAQVRIQRAALFPQVAATASSSSTRIPSGLSTSGRREVQREDSVGLSTAWELDFFGRLRNLTDAAQEQYLATAQARKAFEILLVSQVADQYLTLIAFDELLVVTRKTLDAADASYRLTLLQVQTGTGTELALRQAETVVEQAKANLYAQVRGRAQAENALVLLLGEPLPADLPPATALDDQSIVSDIPAGVPSDLLASRPDIMQAEAVLRGAHASIGAARAAFFPSINLTGNLGTASASLGGLFKAGSSAWSFAPSITVPIFEGGSLRASLDLAVLQKDVSVAGYEKAIQTAFREVADGLAARGTFDDQVAAQERLVAAEQRSLELSELLFRNGAADYLAVLTAQTGLYTDQQTLVTTRMARLTSLVDLYRVLGGGWIAQTGDTPRAADDLRNVDATGPAAADR